MQVKITIELTPAAAKDAATRSGGDAAEAAEAFIKASRSKMLVHLPYTPPEGWRVAKVEAA